MFLLLSRMFIQVRLVILVESLLLQRLCTHVKLGIFETILCIYVCDVIEGMYTCNTLHHVNIHLCLCLCCCRGYVTTSYWEYCKWVIVFMFLFLLRVCTHVRLGIWVTIICVYLCSVIKVMYIYKIVKYGDGHFCPFLCCYRGYAHM